MKNIAFYPSIAHSGLASNGVLDWHWPQFPATFPIYDDYSKSTTYVDVASDKWEVPVQGRKAFHQLPQGRDGFVVRSLITHTQIDKSPSSIDKFTRNVIGRWTSLKWLLDQGSEGIQDAWEEVNDLELARAAKIVLKYACEQSIGEWRPLHASLVKGLNSKAADIIAAQQDKVANRKYILPRKTQDAIVEGIDELLLQSNLSEDETEGLVCLIAFYQHGVRAGELLRLRVGDVKCLVDSLGNPVCHLRMVQGKQRMAPSKQPRMKLRAIRPGWTRPFQQLLLSAGHEKRERFLKSRNWDQLTKNLLNICSRIGANGKFTTKHFRHTLAQYLTDAGHDAETVAKILGHLKKNSIFHYSRASATTSDLLSSALGESKIYQGIENIIAGNFVSLVEMQAAEEDKQIGGVVAAWFIAGIGLCKRGQSHCQFNPITGCYGCSSFLPSLLVEMHREALAAMRAEVRNFYEWGKSTNGKAFLQLKRSIEIAASIVARLEGSNSEAR